MYCFILFLPSLTYSVDAFILSGLGTEFYLYTHSQDREFLNVSDPDMISASNFDPCNQTVLVVTGWIQPRMDIRFIQLSKRIAAKFYNAILVEFNTDHYLASVLKAGADIAAFLSQLVEVTGTNRKYISLMGVSMGAQVVGRASSLYKIGRIIALDPAGPLYDLLPRAFRLDKSDADFVEVVHSSNILGTTNPQLGHVNFIVNDGLVQPGCTSFLAILCNHERAAQVYDSSLDSCNMTFTRCSSYLEFSQGRCRNNPTLRLGLDLEIDTTPKDSAMYFYYTHSSVYPYCGRHEQTTRVYPSRFC